MTENGNFKRRVRSRASKTGESYTTALRHVRRPSPDDLASEPKSVRLAVAQTAGYDDPRNINELHDSGLAMRRLMREARQVGARIMHFPEGTICSPSKRIMSVSGPEEVGPSDWGRVEWAVLREELDATRKLARELGLWTIFGSVHQLTQPRRPHNSLYVVSDRGELVTRYDERMLSNTKISFMYTPGSIPVTFEIDGLCFGCALGMESHFPEIFIEYERLDVDCVLFSTTGGSSNDAAFAAEIQGHAASNSYWIGFTVHAQHSLTAPSGIVAPAVDGPRNAWRMEHPQLPSSILTTIRATLRGLGGERRELGFMNRIWRATTREAVAAICSELQWIGCGATIEGV